MLLEAILSTYPKIPFGHIIFTAEKIFCILKNVSLLFITYKLLKHEK